MLATLSGKSMRVRLVAPLKANSPTDVTPLPKVTLARRFAFLNALPPMLSTLSAIVTSVRLPAL